jgi:hypothetical protein
MSKRSTQTNEGALASFIARKAEIDALLTRLRDASDNHFNTMPDEVHRWRHHSHRLGTRPHRTRHADTTGWHGLDAYNRCPAAGTDQPYRRGSGSYANFAMTLLVSLRPR